MSASSRFDSSGLRKPFLNILESPAFSARLRGALHLQTSSWMRFGNTTNAQILETVLIATYSGIWAVAVASSVFKNQARYYYQSSWHYTRNIALPRKIQQQQSDQQDQLSCEILYSYSGTGRVIKSLTGNNGWFTGLRMYSRNSIIPTYESHIINCSRLILFLGCWYRANIYVPTHCRSGLADCTLTILGKISM